MYASIVKELDGPVPREMVQMRDGGGGRQLAYLAGWYVIDRLNKVLGIGNWAYSGDASLVESGSVVDKYGKEKYSVHYIAKVRLVCTLGDKTTEFTDYGYGDGLDPQSRGKAHELAVKEAMTDGLKRCAKNLGMSMGLALYDKDQENVVDTPQAAPVKPAATQAAPAAKSTRKRESLQKEIEATGDVLMSLGTKVEIIKAHLKDKYKAERSSDLNTEQAVMFLADLVAMLPKEEK
jgi:DNA recombination protein Rad52